MTGCIFACMVSIFMVNEAKLMEAMLFCFFQCFTFERFGHV